jgi:hypothetical protein
LAPSTVAASSLHTGSHRTELLFHPAVCSLLVAEFHVVEFAEAGEVAFLQVKTG